MIKRLISGKSFLTILSIILTNSFCVNYGNIAPFELVSIETVIEKCGNTIKYQEFKGPQKVCYEPLPFVPEEFQRYQPHDVTFDKTWVLTIPNGKASTFWGHVLIDDKYMLQCLLWPCLSMQHNINIINEQKYLFENPRKISGRVAVITSIAATNYAHFLMEILGRLAMLDIMGIDYDWIYMPYEKHITRQPFRDQVLKAWGIDSSKIIEPFDEFISIEADELIVPSRSFDLMPTASSGFNNYFTPLCGVYPPAWLVNYYRDKFLPLVSKSDHFAKKVFISRKDSGLRKLVNEDDVFSLFEAHGFKRYLLTDLTFLQQVELFSSAEIIVGANGAGLYNMMFCSLDAKVIEIFQERVDSTFAFLAQTLGLNYTPVKTVDFPLHDREGGNLTVAPLYIIEDLIKKLKL